MLTRDELHTQFTALAAQLNLDVDVISDGPISAETVIVGEGLGESEIRQGKVFIGGAGTLLFDSIRRHGLNRVNCYTTNVVKRQISLSRKGNEKHIVHRDEYQKWRGLLKWELEQLPNVRNIFVLGNYALEALINEDKVTNWRGSVIQNHVLSNGKKVNLIISINPAYAQREPKMEPLFLMDAHKLGLVTQGKFRPHNIEHIINPTAQQALKWIADLKKARKPWAYDIEVINNETACHGLTNDPHVAMCINLRDATRNRFTTTEEADILLALQDLCDSHTSPMIMQNGGFDSYWTRLRDYLCTRSWFDTLLAHHTLYPQMPHSLATLVAQYTMHPYYKDEGKSWREGGDIDQFWRYNCKDAALTVAVQQRELKELREQGLERFFFDHVMHAQPHLVSATVHGVRVDLALKNKLVEQLSEDVARLEAEFHRLVREATGDPDYTVNPGSHQQMRKLFFDVLKLKGRGQSTDKTNRIHIMKNPQTSGIVKEMLTAFDVWAKEAKFLSTFAEARVGSDNRMRCDYKQYGVTNAPGRLSSTQLLDGTGINMQNQPPRARSFYIADEGCVMFYFDLGQAEARVVAWRARIEKWKEQFERARVDGKYDAHRALASEMFKIPYDQVPLKDFDPATGLYTSRYIAKRCRHGLNYRMERFRLSEVTGLPYHEAVKAFTLYHSTTPELRRWWEQEEKEFRKTRTMYNALGRRWKVIQRLDDDVLSSIIAFYPQSTVGDKITQVWYQCEEDDEWPMGARIAIDVHDNLVGIAEKRVAKTALAIAKRYAESPIMVMDAWGGKPEPLIIPAECKMSTVKRVEKLPNGKLRALPDDEYHRWSNMEVVEL